MVIVYHVVSKIGNQTAKSKKKRLCKEEVKNTTKAEKDDYILGPGKFPLNQDKWGYLPTNLQRILKNKIQNVTGKPCVLRHGVEYSKNQSFLGCISDALLRKKWRNRATN